MARPYNLGMSAWGTAISSNDTFKDVYDDYIHQYNEGNLCSDISKNIRSRYAQIINDPEEGNDALLAIAKAEWECGYFNKEFNISFDTFIENDIQRWRALNASEKDVIKRRSALMTFKQKISSPNPKPRKVKKIVLKEPAFKFGDCIAFRVDANHYGGGIILYSSGLSEYPNCFISITNIYKTSLPKMNDFKTSSVFVKRRLNNKTNLKTITYVGKTFHSIRKFLIQQPIDCEVIGTLNIKNGLVQYGGSAALFKDHIVDFTKELLDANITEPSKFQLLGAKKLIRGIFNN